MFSLTAPSEDEIRRFISKQKDSGFSYPEVGASGTTVPTGYNVDHTRVQLAKGEVAWQRAAQAIRAWQMFNMHGCASVGQLPRYSSEPMLRLRYVTSGSIR